jgi:hypothetical protein
VESFVTKKYSWGQKGLGNQFSRTVLQTRKEIKSNGRGMEIPRRSLRSGLAGLNRVVHIYGRAEGLEVSCRGTQQESGVRVL